VGRGSEKSYCLLVGDTAAPEAMRRLTALESTHDGFKLAMQDLDIRGAGDFLGTQQSGLPPLKVATLTDLSTMEKARAEAQQLIRDERLLGDPMYERMRERVAKLWSTNVEWS
jgi:ATP-dependent DNA helicase RecG